MNEYLTHAYNENKVLVHVDSVENGKACNCTCPHCNNPLVAKNGGRKYKHHFAHLKGIECEDAYETTLHLLAKKVLTEEKMIMLPISEDENQLSGLIHFVDVEQEKKFDGSNIRPDVIGTMVNGEKILIEFYVSHRVTYNKRDFILQNNLKCIEVNLNYVEMEESAIRSFLINETTHRDWIKKYEKRTEGDGYGSYSTRNPLHKKSIDFLKRKFDTDTIKIFVRNLRTGGNTHNLKSLGYDTCELSSSSFRGIKPDLLLYRSSKNDKGHIAICVRGRRRSSDFEVPTNLRIIDIIIRDEHDYNTLTENDTIREGYSYNTVFHGFNPYKNDNQGKHDYEKDNSENYAQITDNELLNRIPSEEAIINDTRIIREPAPF
ncbi:MAG: hypothetical protein MJZ32_02245 [Bacteroidaceae bacterium]|nr:hypothetical protein [Bacteroidaceae bacterium]